MKELAAFKLLQKIDYVVVNAGILKYPNASIHQRQRGLLYSFLTS